MGVAGAHLGPWPPMPIRLQPITNTTPMNKCNNSNRPYHNHRHSHNLNHNIFPSNNNNNKLRSNNTINNNQNSPLW